MVSGFAGALAYGTSWGRSGSLGWADTGIPSSESGLRTRIPKSDSSSRGRLEGNIQENIELRELLAGDDGCTDAGMAAGRTDD